MIGQEADRHTRIVSRLTLQEWLQRQIAARALTRRALLGGIGGLGGLTLIGCSGGGDGGTAATTTTGSAPTGAATTDTTTGTATGATTAVYDTSPYAAKGQNPTTPTNDGIFADGALYQLVTVTENVASGGYDAALTVGISA